jgi:predicted N-acetyltransferase YhbS
VHLRVAAALDLEAVTRLINLAFEVERFYIDGDRITIDAVRDLAAKGSFILAEDDIGLAGCVYVEQRGERAYLGLLSVDPSRQRGGIGARLIEETENLCRNAGCHFMDLKIVNLRTELPPYYKRLGYEQTGTSPFTAGVTTKLPCFLLEMTKALGRQRAAARTIASSR